MSTWHWPGVEKETDPNLIPGGASAPPPRPPEYAGPRPPFEKSATGLPGNSLPEQPLDNFFAEAGGRRKGGLGPTYRGTRPRRNEVRIRLFSTWAELWLVNKIFYTVWGKLQLMEIMLTLLDFGSFLKIPKIVGKSSACPVGVFSMLPNPPKCHIRQKTIKSTILIIK